MAIHNNNSNNSKKTPLSPSRSSSSSQSSLSSLRAAAVATMRDNRKEKKYSVLMLFVVFAVGANAGWFITYLYGGTGGFNRAAAHVSDISFFDGATTVAKTTTITTTTTATASSTETPTIVKASQPKLADGCHHVFMDVGANVGVSIEYPQEPSMVALSLRLPALTQWSPFSFSLYRYMGGFYTNLLNTPRPSMRTKYSTSNFIRRINVTIVIYV